MFLSWRFLSVRVWFDSVLRRFGSARFVRGRFLNGPARNRFATAVPVPFTGFLYFDELLLVPTSMRRGILEGMFGFVCDCDRCEGDDVL